MVWPATSLSKFVNSLLYLRLNQTNINKTGDFICTLLLCATLALKLKNISWCAGNSCKKVAQSELEDITVVVVVPLPSPSPLPLSTSVCGRMLAILFLQALGFAGPFKRRQIEQWTTRARGQESERKSVRERAWKTNQLGFAAWTRVILRRTPKGNWRRAVRGL